MYYFEDIIDEIESRITEDIDVNILARKANMSVYEFRRIFTFITKISFGEYVRGRRLSLAALELYETKQSIAELSGKYGYDSPSSFTRAFKDFHGISPSEVLKGNSEFKLLTRINTHITSTGGKNVSYTVFKKQGFRISGFLDKSTMTDTECCETVWDNFYNSEISGEICGKTDKLYAAYDNGCDFVNCCIGVVGNKYPEGIDIPETEWACFKLVGTDDDYVNGFYNDVVIQWLSSSGYRKNNQIPNIEVFPSDMSEDGFRWEIWIPIKR